MTYNNVVKKIYQSWYDQFHNTDDDLRIIICGGTGKGKSTRGLKFGWELDTTFNSTQMPDMERVILDPYSFMDVLDEKAKPYTAVLGDEAGIWAYSRKWYSIINQNLSKAFQTCRYLNQCYIITLPSMKMLDSHVRDLFHYYVETLYIDRKRDACKCIIKRIQHNPLTGKTYYKYLRIKSGGSYKIVKSVWIPPPDDEELITLYKEKSKRMKKESAADGKKEMVRQKAHDETEWGKPKNIDDIVKEVRANPEKFKSKYKPDLISWKRIANKFNIGKPTAERVRSMIEEEIE